MMGIIPEDEQMIGCECAGVVRKLGPGVTQVRVGDRVAVQGRGMYGNRIHSSVHCVQTIPSWMSFEEAATIPLAYSTAIQALFHLGNLQEGQVSKNPPNPQTHQETLQQNLTLYQPVRSHPLGRGWSRTRRPSARPVQEGGDICHRWDGGKAQFPSRSVRDIP